MNILPCEISSGNVFIDGNKIETSIVNTKKENYSKTEVGIRPEFIKFSNGGIPIKISKVSNTGRHKIIDSECSIGKIKILSKSNEEIPSDTAFISFDKKFTYVYGDDWIIE